MLKVRARTLDFIYDIYELYYVERLENAFEDIDRLINE